MTGQNKTFVELNQRWNQLKAMTNNQERGRKFEVWLKDLFLASGLNAEGSFTSSTPDEQVDGAIIEKFGTFLVEAKWEKDPISADPFRKLKEIIDSRTTQAFGLLISVSGFNDNAKGVAGRNRPLNVFFIDPTHLEALLAERIDGPDWLESILEITNLYAKPYVSIDEILNRINNKKKNGKENPAKGPILLTDLPKRKIELIGRDQDLIYLQDQLKQTKRVLLVNGLGGIGKTYVCKRFFMDHYMEYNVAGWIDFVSSIKESFINSIDPKLVGSKETDTPDDRFKKIKEFFKNVEGAALLIVDNIENDKDPDLDFLAPWEENIKVIANSRQTIEDFEVYNLEFLTEENCKALFYQHYKRDHDDEAVDKLVNLCDRHTLIVELLAKTAQNSWMSINNLYKLLVEKGFNLNGVIPDRVDMVWHDEKERRQFFDHLLTIFDLSNVTDDEMHILVNLSVLPAIYIPVLKFSEWMKLETKEEINSLVRKGWLREDKFNVFTYQFIQEVIRHKKTPDVKTCENLIRSLTGELYYESDKNPIGKKEFIIYADSLLSRIDKNKRDLANLANNLSTIYKAMGQLEKAQEFQLKALKIREAILDKNHPDIAESYNNLSLIYKNIGHMETALEFQLKALKIRGEVLDINYPNMAQSYNNLSLIYKNMGQLEKAQEFQEKALKIREDVLKKDHPDLATSYNNVSLIYQDMGHMEKALEFQEKALKIREAVLDKNHPHLAVSYHNLSGIYRAMGQPAKALPYAEKAVAIMESLFPDGHPNLDVMKRNLERLKKIVLGVGF